ncbi:serine hydrolase domain-containing protein [Metabacillus arenae]|uniref:Serine hydrolase n=1 Tax=Metabacillus arenae TaxID=2771434 RepID=A0A926NCD4_9BACI|nr:serine hydrolase domain-containing protein [Metabacillus arenae]MBD1378954.1 serine hydrolase [Metabacillus arenae]
MFNRKRLQIFLLMCGSLFLGSISVFAQETEKGRGEQMFSIYPFPWGQPGKSSNVLHKGPFQSAGFTSNLDSIDPIIESALTNRTFSGAVMLTARKGVVVKEGAYGYAYQYEDGSFTKDEQPIRTTESTIFDIASISKLFTSTAILMLYEDNKLQLDDPVSRYLPEFAANDKEQVTIRQLLTHTSGFKAWIPLYQTEGNRDEKIQTVLHYPLDHAPGTTYTYSDLNLITLGALVEKLTNQRLDEFVTKHITKPLGMKDTMYNPPKKLKHRIAATEYQPAIKRGMVWGEVHDENAWSLEGIAGHAGVFSTAKDLAIFGHMILQDGKYKGKQLLEKDTVRLLLDNQTPKFPGDDHSLGWELNQSWYMDALSHSTTLGHTGYTGTSLVISKENETIVVLLTNRVHPNRTTPAINPVRREVARKVADAIPIPAKKQHAMWFAGFGDQLENSLEANLSLEKEAKLTFDSWYRMEGRADSERPDHGSLQITKDGDKWETIKTFKGFSSDWEHSELILPKDTKSIRFLYETDDYGNGRGWYLNNIKVLLSAKDQISVNWKSDSWIKRKN